MVRKVQTSINLTPEIKNIIDTEGLNLSKFVNDQLERYFSVSSIEDINIKIAEHKAAIQALEQKRADLLAEGTAETKGQALAEEAEKEIKEIYKNRRDSGIQKDLDRSWLQSPRNLERLKIIGWETDEAVHKLRKWYDDL